MDFRKQQQLNKAEEQIIAGFKGYKIDEEYTVNIYDRGQGEAILFTPVFENTNFIYANQIKYFEKKYRVITYSAREYKSKEINVDLLSNDILSILDILQLKKVNVVTMCITTGNALLACLKRPELFQSFFITNAFVHMPIPEWEKVLAKFLISILPDAMVKKVLVKKIAIPEERVFFLPRFLPVKNFKEKFNHNVLPMLNADLRNQIYQIDVPARVITTEYDPFIPIKYTKFIHDQMKNSTFTVLSGRKGHFLSLLDPDYFNQELELFLTEVLARKVS
ncbi:alpha/beta hydrolase [Desulforamulus ruminis]|uniref:Pimeloyl-ACP methyl ester carboxylesterase n=2 Tax=Desulforamulus ruminis TaxID=1564 RepID=F6DKS7_DESRL|nr:hypothetical protein Desru_2203 [Desulforamulus ruminis DSM 2154]